VERYYDTARKAGDWSTKLRMMTRQPLCSKALCTTKWKERLYVAALFGWSVTQILRWVIIVVT